MTRRNWKHVQPLSLLHAMELCVEHALQRHNRSVARIASLMGHPHAHTLYKWMSNGRIPQCEVASFEQACGINLVTRWSAAHADLLVIDMPTGRHATAQDVNELQQLLTDVTSALISFYGGRLAADATLAAIQNAMEGLAWHRGNVSRHHAPQLDLGDRE